MMHTRENVVRFWALGGLILGATLVRFWALPLVRFWARGGSILGATWFDSGHPYDLNALIAILDLNPLLISMLIIAIVTDGWGPSRDVSFILEGTRAESPRRRHDGLPGRSQRTFDVHRGDCLRLTKKVTEPAK
jgi:hypothetical protein